MVGGALAVHRRVVVPRRVHVGGVVLFPALGAPRPPSPTRPAGAQRRHAEHLLDHAPAPAAWSEYVTSVRRGVRQLRRAVLDRGGEVDQAHRHVSMFDPVQLDFQRGRPERRAPVRCRPPCDPGVELRAQPETTGSWWRSAPGARRSRACAPIRQPPSACSAEGVAFTAHCRAAVVRESAGGGTGQRGRGATRRARAGPPRGRPHGDPRRSALALDRRGGGGRCSRSILDELAPRTASAADRHRYSPCARSARGRARRSAAAR